MLGSPRSGQFPASIKGSPRLRLPRLRLGVRSISGDGPADSWSSGVERIRVGSSPSPPPLSSVPGSTGRSLRAGFRGLNGDLGCGCRALRVLSSGKRPAQVSSRLYCLLSGCRPHWIDLISTRWRIGGLLGVEGDIAVFSTPSCSAL